jgi:hypothetical protein
VIQRRNDRYSRLRHPAQQALRHTNETPDPAPRAGFWGEAEGLLPHEIDFLTPSSYNLAVPKITTSQLDYARELLMHSFRGFVAILSAISLIGGLSAASIAAFLLHQSLGTSLWIGTAGFLVAFFEGSWRLSCKEKDALDLEWRTKYGPQKKV